MTQPQGPSMKDSVKDQWDSQMELLGSFIRSQRKTANLTLRQLAERTRLSNPYLSQIERGLHQPSVRVIRSIAEALNVSVETLLAQAGLLPREEDAAGQESGAGVLGAIAVENPLNDEQKATLIAVFQSMLRTG
jgi:transcriptional regulator with XRE-family HTH domain